MTKKGRTCRIMARFFAHQLYNGEFKVWLMYMYKAWKGEGINPNLLPWYTGKDYVRR